MKTEELIALARRLRQPDRDEQDINKAAVWLPFVVGERDYLDLELRNLERDDRILPPGGVRFEERGWARRDGTTALRRRGLRAHTHVRWVTCWDDGKTLVDAWREVGK